MLPDSVKGNFFGLGSKKEVSETKFANNMGLE